VPYSKYAGGIRVKQYLNSRQQQGVLSWDKNIITVWGKDSTLQEL